MKALAAKASDIDQVYTLDLIRSNPVIEDCFVEWWTLYIFVGHIWNRSL
jgi:hypothetical protein